MKLSLKDITLKKDTVNDINSGNIDIDKYISYIREHFDAANFLIQNKILAMDDVELFDALIKVFDIKLEDRDVLDVLSKKNNIHYFGFTSLNTDMVDSEGNNIVLVGAYSKKLTSSDGIISRDTIRKLVNSYDFVVFDTKRVKYPKPLGKTVSYEDYKFDDVTYDFNDSLFELKVDALKRYLALKGNLKKVLDLLNQYVGELFYQAKGVIRLDDDDESLKGICREYKKALDSNFNKKDVFKKSNHKKSY